MTAFLVLLHGCERRRHRGAWGGGLAGELIELRAELVSFHSGAGEGSFDFSVGAGPDGNGGREHFHACGGQAQVADSAVVEVGVGFKKTAAGQSFDRGGEGGAIHAEELGYGAHGGRRNAGHIGPVEAHEQGELAVVDASRLERFIKAAGQGAGGTLDIETEAGVSHQESGGEGDWLKILQICFRDG